MGCHTWFFTKIERTAEEARKIWINDHKKWMDKWKEICDNPNDHARVTYNWSQEYCDYHLEVRKRQLRLVENGFCMQAVFNKQPDDENILYRYVVGKGLFADNGKLPHDIFRSKYTEVQLFSLDQTLKYISDNKNALAFHMSEEDTIQALTKFWNEYPNGMIEFG